MHHLEKPLYIPSEISLMFSHKKDHSQVEDQNRSTQCGTKKFCMLLEGKKTLCGNLLQIYFICKSQPLIKVRMKVGDFMSAKYFYMLPFWTAMFISTTGFLQAVGSRYLNSYTPDVARVGKGFGIFFFPVKSAWEDKAPAHSSFLRAKHHTHYNIIIIIL